MKKGLVLEGGALRGLFRMQLPSPKMVPVPKSILLSVSEITRLTTSPRLFAMLTLSNVFTDEAGIAEGNNINKTARRYLAV
ncbi:MAG: hypothetical protein IK124_04725 [Prevotella sp.]|nr:hypothetical protein [Prevotella sp.]MBR6944902.1 hypothetical protein [Prevotella sp.]